MEGGFEISIHICHQWQWLCTFYITLSWFKNECDCDVTICLMLYRVNTCRPIPGKVKLLLISGKKSASLLDHISRFLSHQFVTWYLRSISKTKIVKLFCPCMSEHMIYIKNVTNVAGTLHQTKMSQTWPNKILHQKKSWR